MRSQKAYVSHVLERIRRIEEDAAGGEEAFLASHTLQDAIIRNPQVLGESVRRIEEAKKQRHPDIDWRAIAGVRNVLVHDYFDIDLNAVWQIVVRDIPELKRAVVSMRSVSGSD